MKNFFHIILACSFVLASCTADPVPDGDHRMVPVEVSLSVEDVKDATRAAASLFPGVENWIFDYYYCQYNSSGISVTSGHRRADLVNGDLFAVDQVWLWDLEGCTVVYVANIRPAGGSYGDNPGWENGSVVKMADNMDTFRTMKFDMGERLALAEAGTLGHTPMCGYWKGNITPDINSASDPFHMTVTLGRMIVRINLVVTNKSSSAVNGVTLHDAAAKAYIYPQVKNTPLADEDYTDIDNNISIAKNGTANIYFYTAPNFCDGGGRRTSLSFTNAAGKTAVMEIGDNVEDGDYNLYMNTIYTYTITLK